MMRSMRENTKAIMLVTALAFVGLMVFEWGMDLSGQSSAEVSGGEIGRVNRDAVTYNEFLNVYRSLYDQQQQMQEEPITSVQNREIEDAAWEQVVMDYLIRQEVKRRGLVATDAEVSQAALHMPPPEFYGNEMFYSDGQFDIQKYQDFLASPAMDAQLLLQLEAYYRDMIPRNKLYQQVVSGVYASDGELWRFWRDRNETARVRFVALDPQVIVPDADVSVSSDEVEAFYRAHRDDFVRPARATVRLTWFEKAPTAADTASALEHAEAVRAEILEGADFGDVARRESSDPGSAENGGDLGSFGRGQMVPAFDEAVWSLPLNRVSEPVLSAFGYHLIEVTSRQGDEATARHILIPVEMSHETEDELFGLADSLEDEALRTSLEDAASQLGLEVETTDLTPDLSFSTGIGDLDEGSEWAFDEDTELNELSPLFETSAGFYMIELLEREPEGALTLDEAGPQIRQRMINQRKSDRALQIARNLVDQVRGSSLEEAAANAELEVQETEPFTRTDFVPGIGGGNAVIGTAFGLAPNQTSGVIQAEEMFFVIEVLEREEADREEFEEELGQLRQAIMASLEQERWNQFLGALREDATVVDRRNEALEVQEQPQMGWMP